MFPELEHLFRRCEGLRANDRNRQEPRTPQIPFLRHAQQLIEVQLIRVLDVEDNLFQLGTQDSSGGIHVGI